MNLKFSKSDKVCLQRCSYCPFWLISFLTNEIYNIYLFIKTWLYIARWDLSYPQHMKQYITRFSTSQKHSNGITIWHFSDNYMQMKLYIASENFSQKCNDIKRGSSSFFYEKGGWWRGRGDVEVTILKENFITLSLCFLFFSWFLKFKRGMGWWWWCWNPRPPLPHGNSNRSLNNWSLAWIESDHILYKWKYALLWNAVTVLCGQLDCDHGTL